MKILILFLFSTTLLFAQDGFRISKRKGSATYQQAYLNCSAAEMVKLTKDYLAEKPSEEASELFRQFPILDSMDKFKKRTKYSIINTALLAGDPVSTDDNQLIFTFKNGKKYILKMKNRISIIY